MVDILLNFLYQTPHLLLVVIISSVLSLNYYLGATQNNRVASIVSSLFALYILTGLYFELIVLSVVALILTHGR